MALTPYVTNKDALITYIKEELGYPVIAIEVTDKQILNQMNKTLEEYVMFVGIHYHYTQIPVTAGITEYILDYDVADVLEVYDADAYGGGLIGLWPDKIIADHFGSKWTPPGDLLSIELTRHYMQTLEYMFAVKKPYSFDAATKKLYLYEDIAADATIGLCYFKRSDYSDTSSMLYDQRWIKEFATELTRKQWGNNLLKYEGTPLPTGITQNASGILQEAKENIERLRLDLREVYEVPADFSTG